MSQLIILAKKDKEKFGEETENYFHFLQVLW